MKIRKFVIIFLCVIAAGAIIFINISNRERELEQSDSVNVTIEPDQEPEATIYLETYEDLKNDMDVKEESKPTEDNAQEDVENSEKEHTEDIKVRDESDETMKDETDDSNDDYDVNKEPQGEVELSKGKLVEEDKSGDTAASGEDNVGTWD